MTDGDVIEALGKYRLRLVLDQYPDEPDGDGQSPLLRMSAAGHYGGWQAEHIRVDRRPTGNDGRIEEAAAKWGGEPDKLEKYLRAFHGARHFKWYDTRDSRDYKYLTYDTSEWREYTGLPHEEIELDPRVVNGGVGMDDYIAWIEGEVYRCAIQRDETWHAESDPGTTRHTWETVDSPGPYYGYEWAEEAAREDWDDFLAGLSPRICKVCGEDIGPLQQSVDEHPAGKWLHASWFGYRTPADHDAIPAGADEPARKE